MILFPSAKINLGLKVLGKREDGYHELETCMYNIPLFDVLEILPATEFSFRQTGLTIEGDQENNLVVKAFRLMQENFDISNVEMHLLKNIPMGAGLGGGSSDAVSVLLGLNEFFKLEITNDVLRELAAQLGSDCAFFVEDKPQLAKGRGEELSNVSLDLSGYYLKLIHPGVHIGTAEAYQNVVFSSPDAPDVSEVIQLPVSEWKSTLGNDFEHSIFKNHPELETIKQSLYNEGALYASMSGSGSAVFGLFMEEPKLSNSDCFERVMKL